mgnify:CR=1 FL=1
MNRTLWYILLVVLLLALLLAPLVVYTYKVEAINQEEEKIIWFHVKTANFAEKEPIVKSGREVGVAVSEIQKMIEEVFGEDSAAAIKIGECESSLDVNAINWNDSKITEYPSQSIFQINAPYNEELFNPLTNITVAKEMYDRRSWAPWLTCAKKLNLL